MLSHISTLYYKKKKKKYLSKRAEIDIVLVFADNQQKAAGSVSFDLADYPNAGVKSTIVLGFCDKIACDCGLREGRESECREDSGQGSEACVRDQDEEARGG